MFYYINSLFLLILFVINILHFNSFDNQQREKEISSFVALSNQGGVVQAVGFYEERFRVPDDGSNIYHIDIPKISYMKFAYE